MKSAYWLLLGCILFGCSNRNTSQKDEKNPPSFLIGNYEDDYGIKYTIDDTLWFQRPSAKYHILEWVPEPGYLIAQNDSSNVSGGGLFTRIDWVELEGMPPFKWAFCMSAYNAESIEDAKSVDVANREAPRTGCNGFPFSRMQSTISTDTTGSGY